MNDRETVIKALEICAVGTNSCSKCPLKDNCHGTSNAAMVAAIEFIKGITMNAYQEKAQRTRNPKLSAYQHLLNGCLGLAGEAGECCDLLKKREFQDGRDIREKLLDELGDVLWYIAETASALEYSLEEVAAHNIKKLMDRYPEGFEAERSLHRESE